MLSGLFIFFESFVRFFSSIQLHKAYNLVATKVTIYFRTNNKWVMSLQRKLICEMKSKIKLRVLFFDITMKIRVAGLSFKVVKDENL